MKLFGEWEEPEDPAEFEEPAESGRRLSPLGIVVRVFFCAVLLVALAVIYFSAEESSAKAELGVEAVKLMYNFQSVEELESNQKRLARIMDEDTFYGLTYDNENRQLYTYVQYYGSHSTVNVVESTDRYVLYRIESECVESDRLFVMLFEVDGGRIVKVKEGEFLGFVEDVDYLY